MRWFQFGVFCALFRLHGVREPAPLSALEGTGGPNEVWSFGDEAYRVIRDQLALRERLRPYVMDVMAAASATGLPPMRALFLEFPDEPEAWQIKDQYMFGPDVLVAPVITYGAREREVYLPAGASWLDAWTGEPVAEKGWTTAAAPLERIPVYLRRGGALKILSTKGLAVPSEPHAAEAVDLSGSALRAPNWLPRCTGRILQVVDAGRSPWSITPPYGGTT